MNRTWETTDEVTIKCVTAAIKCGYRMIDTASYYISFLFVLESLTFRKMERQSALQSRTASKKGL